MKTAITISLIFLASIATWAKPRFVDLDKELSEATLIKNVEVTGYTETTVLFVDAATGEKFEVKTNGDVSSQLKYDKNSTGYWPNVGEKVLVVIDTDERVSLFAARVGAHYRFWSPDVTGSIALFQFKAPAVKLPNEKGVESNPEGYESCWDGCLYPVAELKLK